MTVVPVPSLADLAATINSEHDLAYRAVLDALDHAVRAGEALLEARRLVPEGQWSKWIKANLAMPSAAVGRYIRIATHRETLFAAGQRPKSINGALTYLREIDAPPSVPPGRNGRRPTFDVSEARRLRGQGMKYSDIGGVLGVSDVAVWRQLTPGATRKAVARTTQARSKRRAEARALAEKELAARVARVGGHPSDAYALLRRCAVALDRAITDAEPEMRPALRDALTYTHRAEDAIVRALGIERGRERRV